MKLSDQGLQNKQEWISKGYQLPAFDRSEMIANTHKNPVWVHFGAGNIFRAFHANLAQKALESAKALIMKLWKNNTVRTMISPFL